MVQITMGVVKLIELWRALGKVEPSHEIAPQSLSSPNAFSKVLGRNAFCKVFGRHGL